MAELWTIYKTCLDFKPWCVYNEFGSDDIIEYFPTQAEAIAYVSRANQGEKQ